MLNGLDPIIIFQIFKKTAKPTRLAIPLTSGFDVKFPIAVIPLYLSESITGVYIDSESKNIDIETDTNSLFSGEASIVNQKTLGAVTTISMIAKQDSVGLTILLALSELLLDKASSGEYGVTYMHGAVTVFNGLVHSFSYEQGSDNDLYKIKLEIARGGAKGKSIPVDQKPDATRLGNAGVTPDISAPKTGGVSPPTSKIGPTIGGVTGT